MALPPGFDLSAMQNILNNPEIRQMAEQMASDPSFQAITQQLAGMGLAPGAGAGALPGAAAPAAAAEPAAASTADSSTAAARSMPAAGGAGAGAAAAGMPGMPGMPAPGAGGMPVNPEEYMKAMQNIMQNPEFAKMAEDLGKKMFENDPQLASMVQTMQDPGTRNHMEDKMKALKDDPELKHIIEELETGGPAAMMKYWNDPDTMQKIGKAFGDMPGIADMFGGAAGGAGAARAVAGGADEAEAEGEEVDSAFLAAAMEGDLAAVKKFIADGGADFDVNENDGQGRSALHFACGYGETEVVKELLNNKAAVTCLDSDKNTPLHYAAGYGETACVKLLLEHGAGLTEKNADGKTPLDVAQLNEQAEIATMLQDQEKDAFL